MSPWSWAVAFWLVVVLMILGLGVWARWVLHHDGPTRCIHCRCLTDRVTGWCADCESAWRVRRYGDDEGVRR